MYNSIASSQQVLNKICVAVNHLQGKYKEIQDDISMMKCDGKYVNANRCSMAAAAHVAPDDSLKNVVMQDVRNMMSNFQSELDSIRKDVAVLKLAPRSSPASTSTTPPPDMDAFVKRECEASSKKQRDLLEALLTAKYDRMITRSVQDACENQRRELLCRVDSTNQDLASSMETRIQHAIQVTSAQFQQQLHMQQQQIAHLQAIVTQLQTAPPPPAEPAASQPAEADISNLVINETKDEQGRNVVELQIKKSRGRPSKLKE